MVQALNTKLFLEGNANAMMSPVNIKQVRIFYGDQGIEFRANAGGGYIQIPWTNIETISMEIFLKFYFRGFLSRRHKVKLLNLSGAKLSKR